MGDQVLILGSGGREHALAWKLAQSPRVHRVLVAPGNDGMRDVARLLPANDAASWRQTALAHDVDLVVVGPEAPLVAGLADDLREDGLRVFGPGREGARLEGDKAFAKEFLHSAGIRTAASVRFDDLDRAVEHLRQNCGPCVVKATGLAAGKGVIVCDDSEQAIEAVRLCLQEDRFGVAGHEVLIEERLTGPELSVFAVLDGERMAWFAPSRDHKRLEDGDRGPNTGGMGAYTPVSDADRDLQTRIEKEILLPAQTELQRRGIDYRGLLYVGLMLTDQGPSVLEFNCRFGDPETQVVMPCYEGDLYELLAGAADSALPQTGALQTRGVAVGVVLASAGYPASSTKGIPIPALASLGKEDLVFHAGTRNIEGQWVTAGGRVLCAVATAQYMSDARHQAHALANRLHFDGAQSRSDIGVQEEAAHG